MSELVLGDLKFAEGSNSQRIWGQVARCTREGAASITRL